MKGFIIDGDYLLPVKMYMERLQIPYAKLKRPKPRIDIVTVEISIWE